MKKRQGILVGLLTVFFLILLNSIGSSIENKIRGVCTTNSIKEYSSPNGIYTVIYRHTECSEKPSYVSLLVRNPEHSNEYGVILKTPAQFQSGDGTIIDPVTFGLKWEGDNYLDIHYPEGLTTFVGKEESFEINSITFGEEVFYGLHVELVPYAL